MRTLGVRLAAIFGRPELADRYQQVDEPFAFERASLELLLPEMVLMAATIAQRAEENFPSKAYGPYLKDRGVNPFWAQGLGSLAISLGTRTANKSRQLAKVVEALRFLARRNRQKRGILSRAKILLADHDETSIVDQIFNDAGLSAGELVRLWRAAVNEEPLERDRIREIAAGVVRSLPSVRGRRVSAASAAHEEFLKFARIVGLHGYTYSNDKEDFVDERTKSTRVEFDDPDFDPRSAYQRFSAAKERSRVDGRGLRAVQHA